MLSHYQNNRLNINPEFVSGKEILAQLVIHSLEPAVLFVASKCFFMFESGSVVVIQKKHDRGLQLSNRMFTPLFFLIFEFNKEKMLRRCEHSITTPSVGFPIAFYDTIIHSGECKTQLAIIFYGCNPCFRFFAICKCFGSVVAITNSKNGVGNYWFLTGLIKEVHCSISSSISNSESKSWLPSLSVSFKKLLSEGIPS